MFIEKFAQRIGAIDPSEPVAPGQEIHVSKGGRFPTIQSALDSIACEGNVAIIIHPGVYPEPVLITRPQVHLIGLGLGETGLVQIGPVKIAPTSAGDVHSTVVSMERLMVTGDDHLLQVNGDVALSLHISHCSFYGTTPEKKALFASGTGKSKFFISQTKFDNIRSFETTLDISSAEVKMEHCRVHSGGNPCIAISDTATASIDASYIEGYGSQLITVGSNLTIVNTGLASGLPHSDGVVLSSGATFISVHNLFNIPGGTGYAVKGMPGSVFSHAHNAILYGTNTKISAGMLIVPMSTSFTAT